MAKVVTVSGDKIAIEEVVQGTKAKEGHWQKKLKTELLGALRTLF